MIRPPVLPDLRVVLADPDEFTRRSTREILRAARVQHIAEADTAAGLVQRLTVLTSALVLIDVELPALDSPTLHDAVVSGRHLLVLTGRRVTPSLAAAARHVTPGGIILKPFVPNRLWLRLAVMNRVIVASTAGQNGHRKPAHRLDGRLGDYSVN